jgi:hypothetical protein
MAWKKGPLPANTWNWGAVIPVGEQAGSGFYFADFCGDHVKICPGDRVLKADEVAFFDNSIELYDPAAKGTRLSS